MWYAIHSPALASGEQLAREARELRTTGQPERPTSLTEELLELGREVTNTVRFSARLYSAPPVPKDLANPTDAIEAVRGMIVSLREANERFAKIEATVGGTVT